MLAESLTQFGFTGVAIDADDSQKRLACLVLMCQNDLSRPLVPSPERRHHFDRRSLFVCNDGDQLTDLLERPTCARFWLPNSQHDSPIAAIVRPLRLPIGAY